MHSVRRRLTLWLASGFVCLSAGGGFVVHRAVTASATADFDEALWTKAKAFKALTEQERGRVEFDYTKETMPEFEREDRPEFFQFWLDDGTVLLRSRRLTSGRDLPRSKAMSEAPLFRDAQLPDARAGRLIQISFVPHTAGASGDAKSPDTQDPEVIGAASGPRALVLVMARDRADLDRMLARLAMTLLLVVAGSALLAALLVWRGLVWGFRPIADIAAQVEGLDTERLGDRVTVPGTPRELAGVLDRLNGLLGRLEAARERERRFTGNVAHELRTPIAELGALAAVGARWPGDETSVERFFEDVQAISTRMERLVADLLLLARCQAGVEAVARGRTNLAQVVRAEVGRLAPEAGRRGLEIDVAVPTDLFLETDAGKLSMVVSNLLGNAVSHARADTVVRCVARAEGARLAIEITNDADPLDRADLARLTEPFWRKDAVRSPGEHHGLGLSIVSSLCALLGLDLRFDAAADGTFRVRVEGKGTGGAAGHEPSRPPEAAPGTALSEPSGRRG